MHFFNHGSQLDIICESVCMVVSISGQQCFTAQNIMDLEFNRQGVVHFFIVSRQLPIWASEFADSRECTGTPYCQGCLSVGFETTHVLLEEICPSQTVVVLCHNFCWEIFMTSILIVQIKLFIPIGHEKNIPMMQFFSGVSRNTQSKTYMKGLPK